MTKERYKEIRNKQNFLYLYFTENGGKVEEQLFHPALVAWFTLVIGVQFNQGVAQIVKYLDEKFSEKN
jgi:hypothetical protein